MNKPFTARFWGVRGSIACPGPATMRYGGNTACVEVRCGDRLVIFDGGTGIRELGDSLIASAQAIDADILLSHCHIDHVSGLPFFAPFFSDKNRFRLAAGHLRPQGSLESALRALMSHPLFPVEVEIFRADMAYRDFAAGETFDLGNGIRVRTVALDHPGGATGYRLDFDGRSLVYLTDNEIRPSGPHAALLDLVRDADVAIYDCTYTDAEIGAKSGWGHSSWRQGIGFAQQAGIKSLWLFHHAPEHDDAAMDRIAEEARAAWPQARVATEGATIAL